MIERLKRIGRRVTPSAAHCECRRCGTTIETVHGGCPACGSTEIARYEI